MINSHAESHASNEELNSINSIHFQRILPSAGNDLVDKLARNGALSQQFQFRSAGFGSILGRRFSIYNTGIVWNHVVEQNCKLLR